MSSVEALKAGAVAAQVSGQQNGRACAHREPEDMVHTLRDVSVMGLCCSGIHASRRQLNAKKCNFPHQHALQALETASLHIASPAGAATGH
jgi:hypothetical protein